MVLNNEGFTRQGFDDWFESIEAQALSTIAPNISTDENSTMGNLLRMMASMAETFDETAESVWQSQFVSQANGVSLDRLGANMGVLRKPALAASVSLKFEGPVNTVISDSQVVSTDDGITFYTIESKSLSANGQFDEDGNSLGEATLMALATDAGPDSNVAAGTLTTAVEAPNGVTVSNDAAATGGTESEDDESYRSRLMLTYASSPVGTIDNLISQIRNTDGVTGAYVVENNTMQVDEFNNPPKSVHFYVKGGTDAAIADTIFNNVVAGIQTVGEVSVNVVDIGGIQKHAVNFSRAIDVVIDIDITLTTDSTFDAVNGNSDIQTMLGMYFAEMNMGDTVYFSKLYSYVYAVQGVQNATITMAKNGEVQAQADITMAPNEVGVMGSLEVK